MKHLFIASIQLKLNATGRTVLLPLHVNAFTVQQAQALAHRECRRDYSADDWSIMKTGIRRVDIMRLNNMLVEMGLRVMENR